MLVKFICGIYWPQYEWWPRYVMFHSEGAAEVYIDQSGGRLCRTKWCCSVALQQRGRPFGDRSSREETGAIHKFANLKLIKSL